MFFRVLPKILILFSFMAISCQSDEAKNLNESEQTSESAIVSDSKQAVLTTIHGDLTFEFFPEKAPVTVKRIQELISQGFYNGITFHRVVPGFVVQAGDPTGTGTSGSGKKLKAEFSDVKHVKGIVAMARTQDPNSADSQFYIALADIPHLDGKYTVFAKVTKGLELLDKIKVGDKIIKFSLK